MRLVDVLYVYSPPGRRTLEISLSLSLINLFLSLSRREILSEFSTLYIYICMYIRFEIGCWGCPQISSTMVAKIEVSREAFTRECNFVYVSMDKWRSNRTISIWTKRRDFRAGHVRVVVKEKKKKTIGHSIPMRVLLSARAERETFIFCKICKINLWSDMYI